MGKILLILFNIGLGYVMCILGMVYCSDEKFINIIAKFMTFRAKRYCETHKNEEE